jgi:hypothetical protein
MIPRYDSGAISPAAAGLAPLQTPMLQVLRRGERGSQVCLLAELGSCASCWATRLCHAGPGRDTRVSGGVNDNLPLSPFPSSAAEAIHEVGHCRTGEPASNRLALMATLNASLAEYLASSPVVRVSGRSSRTTAGQEWACLPHRCAHFAFRPAYSAGPSRCEPVLQDDRDPRPAEHPLAASCERSIGREDVTDDASCRSARSPRRLRCPFGRWRVWRPDRPPL